MRQNIITYKTGKTGLTMVELFIVIGVIAIIAALAFVALNPLAKFQDSRNAQRWADVNAIMSAIKLHQFENNGKYLGNFSDLTDDLYYQIGYGSSCNDTCSNPNVVLQADCIDLSSLVDDSYFAEVPVDPKHQNAGTEKTRYYLVKHTNGTLEVGSCSEELGSKAAVPDISVKK